MIKRARSIATRPSHGCLALMMSLVACSASDDASSEDGHPARPADDGSLAAEADTAVAASDASDAPCESRACWCGPYCDKVAATGCRNDPALSECMTRCVAPTVERCVDESYALLVCRARLAPDAFRCAPVVNEIMPIGCESEVGAFDDCLEANPP